MNSEQDWNPNHACKEMAALFNQADQIMNQPHYQDVVSGEEVHNPTADSSKTTNKTIIKD